MYEASYYAGSAVYSFLTLICFFFFIIILVNICREKRKSKKYREILSDMYVSAKIREIAKDENISLDDEYKTFLKWCKKTKYEDWSYDNVIEAELKEKVETKLNKESPKI